MIIQLKPKTTEKELQRVIKRLIKDGIEKENIEVIRGDPHTVLGIKGDTRKLSEDHYETLESVYQVIRISDPCKELTKYFHPKGTTVELSNGHKIGEGLTVIAGPCAVESYKQLLESAKIVKKAGANVLRGGAYKPRTSPDSFQGLGEEGLKYLAKVKKELGMPIITELTDIRDLKLFEKYDVDIIQIGARNCQNFRLLDEMAKVDRPVMLKRGSEVSVTEYLLAALRIYRGNRKVILCERGGKTHDPKHRNVLNLNNVVYIKQNYHLPIIVDPSHGSGIRKSVAPLSCAGIAAGADGVMIEVHCNPEEALCDGDQSIDGEIFDLIPKLEQIYRLVQN
ncbi:MAG: 3-deoxy-7-phosphoheptulonate synthase [Nanoarchaeota archaeon]|nr:3-deoxy-7-phosphoheptulonate synthase [Nanoarchaeota archaeon]MBU1854132.1 3-deoxy-7-phosphoheptulonate synthase [Nanoarchaeota archaeon]